MKVKITSAIAIDGKIAKPGSEIEVTDALGKNLIGRGRAEEIIAAPAAPAESAAAAAPAAPVDPATTDVDASKKSSKKDTAADTGTAGA